jgi:hypothetical protein
MQHRFTHAARLAAQAIVATDPWEKQLWLDKANLALSRAWTELDHDHQEENHHGSTPEDAP